MNTTKLFCSPGINKFFKDKDKESKLHKESELYRMEYIVDYLYMTIAIDDSSEHT